MVSMSMNSFEILPSPEQNGDVEENLQLADFVDFSTVQHASGQASSSLSSASIHSSIDLAVPDLTAAEMCQRLKNLLHENIDLKDKLQRNNKIMHEQLNTIAAWHSQIAQTNSKHRAMLEDLVKQNQKLQSEKEELEKKVADLKKLVEVQPACSDCEVLKVQLSELEKKLEDAITAEKSASEQVMELTNVVEDLKESMMSTTSELNRVHCDIKFLEEEKEQLKELNADLTLQLSRLKYRSEERASLATIVSDEESDYAIVVNEDIVMQKNANDNKILSDTLVQCHEFQTTLSKTMKSFDEEKLKSESLQKLLEEKEKEVENLRNKYRESESENQEKMTVISMLTEERDSLSSSALELQQLQERCVMLESEVSNYKEQLSDLRISDSCVAEKLRVELRFAEEELKQKQLQVIAHKEKLAETEQNFKRLVDKHDDVLKLMDDKEQEFKAQMNSIREVEAVKNQEQLDTLTAKLLDMEQYLYAEQEKVEKLKNELQTLTDESTSIPVLKAQIEVYKEEIEVERKAKLAAEANDQLQSQKVQALEQEIADLQQAFRNSRGRKNNHHGKPWVSPLFYGAGSKTHSRGRSASQHEEASTAPVETPEFVCPCCMLSFENFKDLEAHVEPCLDQSSSAL